MDVVTASSSSRFQSASAVRLAAWLVLSGALLSGPIAMAVVALVAPQPTWTTVESFVQGYHPIQALPYLLGYILLAGFVLFTAACHAQADAVLRVRTSAALVFAAIYATLVFTNYTVQLAFIPRVLASSPGYVSLLTMANPASFAWFLEMFGYAAMGVATWLVAPGFTGSRRAVLSRWLLIANGVASIAAAACTAAFDRFVFSTAGLVSFAAWNLLIVVCFLVIATSPDRHDGRNDFAV